MLAGFFHGVVHDRKLLREAQVNIAYRWFAGYELDEPLPHHSSLTRIRQRWGEERFRAIFERSVMQCVQAGLVGGEMLHLDASLIRADVSWRSLVQQHVSKVLAENEAAEQEPESAGKPKQVSATDPDASLAKMNASQRLEPSYKQHTAVDDRATGDCRCGGDHRRSQGEPAVAPATGAGGSTTWSTAPGGDGGSGLRFQP